MGPATPMAFTVTPPELIGVLAWWGVMLAAPVILVRRWRRRHKIAPRRPLLRLRLRRRATATIAASPAVRETRHEAREPRGELGSRSAAATSGDRPPAGTLAVSERNPMRQRKRSLAPTRSPARLAPRTLEPLCRYVDFRRRLELAASELEAKLSELPPDRWRIEPYPLTGERRNTLLILGETGVFVISATYAPGHWDDAIAIDKLARKIQLLLPGYSGQVQPAICHPFTVAPPRIWHRPDEHGDWIGAWLLGGDSVIEWLEHFGTEHGLSTADLERFDRLSTPNWLKAAIPTAPSWPPIQQTAPCRPQE